MDNYGISPDKARHDKRLKPLARLILIDILSLSNGKGYCWANNRHFSDLYEIHKVTVSTLIKSLESLGYISIKTEFGKRQIHPLHISPQTKGVSHTTKGDSHTTKRGISPETKGGLVEGLRGVSHTAKHNSIKEKDNSKTKSINGKGDQSPTQKNEEVEEVETFDIFDDIEADEKEKSFAKKESKPFLVRDNPPTIDEIQRQMQYAAENLGKSGNWYSLAEDFHHWYSDLDWSHNGTPFKSWDGRAYSWVKYPSKQKRKDDKPKGMSVSNRYSDLLKEMNKNK